MADYSLIEGALQRGYSMDEIADKLAQAEGFDPSAIRARGYGAEEIIGRLGYVKPEAPKATRNAFAYANDTAIDVANSATGLLKAGVDLVAPDSSVSESMSGFIKRGEESQSDWKKQSRADLQQKLSKANGEFDKAGIYAKHAVVNDPLGTAAQIAGNVAPFAIAGRAMQGLQATSKVIASVGLSSGLTAGEVRGNIYEKIKNTPDSVLSESSQEYMELRKRMSEDEAKSVVGSSIINNIPELAAAAIVGGLGGKYGFEGMMTGVAPKFGGRIGNGLIGVADEATQGAVEQLASNVGVRRVLPNQSLTEDVGLNAAAEGIMGVGAVAAPVRPSVAPPPSITSASSTDDAIKAFKDEVETASPAPRGSFGGMDEFAGLIENERSDLGKRRGLLAQQQQEARDMVAEFSGLVKDEQIDQSYRINDAQKQRDAERTREGGYDLALQQREEQQGRTVEQLAAASEAQGFGAEEPTAMQLAMQQAQQKALDNEFSGLLKQERASLNEMRANVKRVAGVPVEQISTPQLEEIAQSEAHPNTKMAAVAALNDRHDAIQQERERLMQLRETRLEKQSNQPEQGAQHGAESHGTDGQVATPSVAGGGTNVSGGGFDAAMVAADRGMRETVGAGAAVSSGGQVGAVPVAEQSANVRALTENAAKRQATQLTNQGYPTVAYPHPTQAGMWAIGSQDEAKAATVPATSATQNDAQIVNVRQHTTRRKPASNTIAQAIINLGGISTSLKTDILGDASIKTRPGLFTTNGTGDLGEIAAMLSSEFGFSQIDLNDPTDNSGGKQLADLIARSVNGESILNEEAMIRAQQDEEFEQAKAEVNLQAQEIGIKPIRGKRTIDIVQSEINAILAEREEMSRQKKKAQLLLDEVAEQELIEAFDLAMQEYHDETAISRDESRVESARLSAEESAQGDGDSVNQASPVAGRASPTEGGRGEAEVTPEFGLTGQTEEEAIAEEQARNDAEAKRQREEQDAENKRQADAERDSFNLSGSTLPADELAARGQEGMFEQKADPIAAVKATLDAAGVTGTDRTSTIAAVRRGDLTPEDVAEAHPSPNVADSASEGKPIRPYATPDERNEAIWTLQAEAKSSGLEYSNESIKDAAEFGAPANEIAAAIDAGEDAVADLAERYAKRSNGLRQGFGQGNNDNALRENMKPPSEHEKRIASLTGHGLYELTEAQRSSLLKFAKVRSIDAFEEIAFSARREIIGRWLDMNPAETKQPATYTIAEHSETIDKLNAGTLTVEEYKAAFARAIESREALAAEFQKMTKDAIMKTARLAGHYKNDTKDRIVKAAANETVEAFDIRESITWVMGTDRFASLRNFVEGVTQADLDAYAAKRKAKIEEYVAGRQAMREGIDNPQTLEDFRNAVQMHKHDGKTFAEARMMLTPEQRATFDELTAEESRKTRNYRADQKAVVQVAAATTEGQIVQTKHTKTGEDLFVVKAAERVERDVYNQWNATAKKLGGWYSSFRGAGAVPGFQFKTMENAEAFLKYFGGDVSEAKAAVQERRDAFADDKSQSAVERLREMAERLDEKADEALGRDRKANTARRARFAAAAESAANGDKAMAATMRNIAQAIESGSAKFLDRVRQKTQIEMLNSLVSTALWDYWRAKYPTYSEQERHKGEPAVPEVADYARFPQYTAFRSDLAKLGRQMLEIDGAKKIGQQLLSVADDVTDAYLEFAKANLHKVSTFKRGDGQMAAFSSRDAAEKAIARSGYRGKAIVLPFKRGQNIIVQSPSFAKENGIWEGDGDKLITLNAEVGSAIVAKGKELGRKLDVPSSFGYVAEKQSRLRAMGIETPAEFRAMLREFIGMKQAPKSPDRVKELERAMAGKRNTDGLDFFPTPAGTVRAMLDAAEIEPGMRVLEPSAGMGHIADLIRDAGVEPDVVELSNDRRELLEAKGYTVVGSNFMDMNGRESFTFGDVFRAPDGKTGIMRGEGGMSSNRVRLVDSNGESIGFYDQSELVGVERNNEGYDRILMNPPFGDRRDAEHVRHAFDLLASNGRLVAIMGEGVFFGQDKKATEFREWLESVGGTSEKLDEGTFLDPSLPVNTGANARLVVIDKKAAGLESRRVGFAHNALQELATEDALFRYPVSKSLSVDGVMHEVFPGVEYYGEHTLYNERAETGADHRYVFQTPDTPAKDGNPEVKGKQFEVFTTDAGRVWVDVHRLQPGDQGSRVYAAVANYAYNARKVFGGDPVGVSPAAIIARTKMMLASALRFGTTRHLYAAREQEKGMPDDGIPPLEWRGNDIDKTRALIQNYLATVHSKAPAIRNYRYDFDTKRFVNNATGLEFYPSWSAFDAALGEDQRDAAGIGADSGRAAILIQSLVSEESGRVGDGGILQAILNDSRALIEDGGLKGLFSMTTPANAGVSVSAPSESVQRIQSVADRFKSQFKGTAALDIRVVSTTFDIPARFRPSPFAEGVFHDDAGLVYLVTMNLRNPRGELSENRAWQVLLHESVGHYGLSQMMGDKFASILKAVKQATLAGRKVSETQSNPLQPGDKDYTTWEAVKLRYPKASDAEVAQEVLARMSETDSGSSVLGYAVAVVRQWVREMARAMGINLVVSTSELRDLVAKSSGYMRRGDNLAEERVPSGLVAASTGVAREGGKRGLESRAATVQPQGPIWSAPEMSRTDNIIYTMQDKNIDLKRVQQAIKSTAGEIRDDIDAYLQEELFHGRAAKITEEFLDKEVNPLISLMRASNVSMDELETFLWARHAKERNAQIAKINDEMPDGGSGLTNKQADDLMGGKDVTIGDKTIAGVKPARKKLLSDLAGRVDAITRGNRALLERYSLESADTLNAWDGAYKHYVPLHREDAESHLAGMGTGQGYSVKGASSKRATGSSRPVENILANLALQRERIITRGEKNFVAQSLYGLAKEMPNADLWEVDVKPTMRTTAMIGGREQVVDAVDPNFRNKPNVVFARFNGEDRFVVFNEHNERALRMAEALKNLDADDISHLLGEVSRWTRYFASINTQYNPIFGVTNLVRDVQTGLLNLKSTPIEGKQKELMGNLTHALPAVFKALRADRKGQPTTGTWAQLWEEFQEVGGQTGYRDMFRNSHERAEALQNALDPTWWQKTWWGKAATVGGVLAVPEQAFLDKVGKPLMELLSDYNTMMENGIRLAAYKVALDTGMTQARAASLAKNLTVNFNRKGQAARQVGSLYAFFNASVQGTARMAETLNHGAKPGELLGKAGKQIIYGGLMLGALQAMLLLAAGFDDEEPPEFVRDRNIIIPTGNGKYISIPLPLGFHVLPAISRISIEFTAGGFKKPGEHLVHIMDVLLDSFNPIGNAGLSMQTVAPTVLDPIAALTENKDWSGRQIARQDFSKLNPTPGYTRAKDTASFLSRGLAYALNYLSGGGEYGIGVVSPTPDQIDYLLGQLTGGVGRELGKVVTTAEALTTGEDLPPHKIPLVGRFYGDTTGQSSEASKFYGTLEKLSEHSGTLDRMKDAHDVEAYREYAKEHPEIRLYARAARVQREMASLRKLKRKMIERNADRAKVRQIEDRMRTLMTRFNQSVSEQKGDH